MVASGILAVVGLVAGCLAISAAGWCWRAIAEWRAERRCRAARIGQRAELNRSVLARRGCA